MVHSTHRGMYACGSVECMMVDSIIFIRNEPFICPCLFEDTAVLFTYCIEKKQCVVGMLRLSAK